MGNCLSMGTDQCIPDTSKCISNLLSEDKQHEKDFKCNGIFFADCSAANRIKWILNKYNKLTSDIQNEAYYKLQDEPNQIQYSNAELMNDFYHIKYHHNTNDDENQFNIFYKYLFHNNNILKCDINNCQRNRLINDDLNIISRIHIYFIHSQDISPKWKYKVLITRFINTYSKIYAVDLFIPDVIISIICHLIGTEPINDIEITKGEFSGTLSLCTNLSANIEPSNNEILARCGTFQALPLGADLWEIREHHDEYQQQKKEVQQTIKMEKIVKNIQNTWYIIHDASIIFDSMMKIKNNMIEFVDVGVILTKDFLYFTSPNNYQTWKQFKDRSKIDELMDEQTKIDEEMAAKLVNNLNITYDEDIISKMVQQLTGNTRIGINQHILFNKQSIPSLFSLFGLPFEASTYPNADNKRSFRMKYDDGLYSLPVHDANSINIINEQRELSLSWKIQCAINRLIITSKKYQHFDCKVYAMNNDFNDHEVYEELDIECKLQTKYEVKQWIHHLSKIVNIKNRTVNMNNMMKINHIIPIDESYITNFISKNINSKKTANTKSSKYDGFTGYHMISYKQIDEKTTCMYSLEKLTELQSTMNDNYGVHYLHAPFSNNNNNDSPSIDNNALYSYNFDNISFDNYFNDEQNVGSSPIYIDIVDI